MEKKLEKILDNNEIMDKVNEIAKHLDKKYEGKNPVIVGVMRGALYFMSDLTQAMTIDLEVDVMSLSSYGTKTTSSGVVKILKDLDIPVENRHVIVLEDIIDTGTTLQYLKKYFSDKNAVSVETISIFEKEDTNITKVNADLTGFVLPNYFLVGYGLDAANQYRHLKHVYKIVEENEEN